MAMQHQHALVRWCEDPPKWDVVNVRDIRTQGFQIGSQVEARYKDQLYPAIVLRLGKLCNYWTSLIMILA